MYENAPFTYDFLNVYNAPRTPGTIHCHDTTVVTYFRRYLFQKMISVLDIDLPEEWPRDYFLYVLYALGFVGVTDIWGYGVIPQNCTLSGLNIYYQPKEIIIANPALRQPVRRTIGKDCGLIRLTPDYRGTIDIINTYADLMGLCIESAGINLINSKAGFVFGAQNKRQAESYKKMYDQINEGQPAAFVDKDLFNEDGELNITTLQQDLKNMYITPDIINTLKQIECLFDADVGLPNNPTEKKERLITDEVNANNASTYSKINLWVDMINESAKTVNALYGLHISARAKDMVIPEESTEEEDTSYESDTEH